MVNEENKIKGVNKVQYIRLIRIIFRLKEIEFIVDFNVGLCPTSLVQV